MLDVELAKGALHPLPGLADQDASGDRLVLPGILAQDQHAGGAVEPAAVEDRSPLHPEVGGGVDLRSGEHLVARRQRPAVGELDEREGLPALVEMDPGASRTSGTTIMGQ